MSTVEVKDQVRLPLSKCVELVLSGVRFRLFRAAITVVIISLATAFLMTILAEGMTARRISSVIRRQTAPRRLFNEWKDRLSSKIEQGQLSRQLYRDSVLVAGPGPDRKMTAEMQSEMDAAGRRLEDLQKWGGLTEPQMKRLIDHAKKEHDPATGVLAFFDGLSDGQLLPLVGSLRGDDILRELSGPDSEELLKSIKTKLPQVRAKLPVSIEELEAIATEWKDTVALREKIITGHADAIEGLAKSIFKNRTVTERLATAEPSTLPILAGQGFQMSEAELDIVRFQAAQAVDVEVLERLLTSTLLTSRLAHELDAKPLEVNASMLFEHVRNESGARWLHALAADSKGFRPTSITTSDIQKTALSQVPLTQAQLAEDLTRAVPGKITWQSPKAWGDLTDEQTRQLVDVAREFVDFYKYFEALNDKDRPVLLGKSVSPDRPFGDLIEPMGFERFLARLKKQDKQYREPEGAAKALLDERLAPLRDKMEAEKDPAAKEALKKELEEKSDLKNLPSSEEILKDFLAKWAATDELRQRVVDGRNAALAAVQASVRELGPTDARDPAKLSQAVGTHLDKAHQGILKSPGVLTAQAELTLSADTLAEYLKVKLIRELVGLRLGRQADSEITSQLLFQLLTDDNGAKWFSDSLDSISGLEPLEISPQRITEVAREKRAQEHRSDIASTVSQAAGGGEDGGMFAGFSSRTMWLIVVSFVVCIVGIANAMLMSVTERFREIATMKCLGATDGFIMVNFVLESCLQGIFGGIIGAILGLLLGMISAMASYGVMALQHLPWGPMLLMAGISIVVGLGISALAAVYPAGVAAKLAPMEAMRIE